MKLSNFIIFTMYLLLFVTYGWKAVPCLVAIFILATFRGKRIMQANVAIIAMFVLLIFLCGVESIPALITIGLVTHFREEKWAPRIAAAAWGVFLLIYAGKYIPFKEFQMPLMAFLVIGIPTIVLWIKNKIHDQD